MNLSAPDAARAAARALADLAEALERADTSAPRPLAPTTGARPTPPLARPAPSSSYGRAPVAKFGRCQGQPLDAIDDKDLSWLASAIERSVNDPSKAKYRATNEADLRDVRAEQDRRFTR